MRALLLFFAAALALFGMELESSYNVTYGIFGKVAKARAVLERNETDYNISVKVYSTGIAKVLSNNRREYYFSRGKVVDGFLRPEVFKRVKESTKRKDVKEYHFDHAKRQIIVKSEKNKYGKFHTKSQEVLPYYTKDDILSLYFNLKKLLKPKQTRYTFYAVGGSEQNGKIDLILPQGKELKELKEDLKVSGLYLKVILYQKIFASKKGELYLVVDEDGVTKKGLLKDVIFFGDIVGTLTKKRIYE
ncbi:MAG: DUF3108 domain-containing protein [Epsilonproteobacteria bacterium]|nr:DUF3108 domain-containing protein [Campylobacterota bacterium]